MRMRWVWSINGTAYVVCTGGSKLSKSDAGTQQPCKTAGRDCSTTCHAEIRASDVSILVSSSAHTQSRKSQVLSGQQFNNYFHPEVAAAATEVLEKAGYQVIVSLKHLCCGRPLYDYGFLDLAESYLHAITTAIQPYLKRALRSWSRASV